MKFLKMLLYPSIGGILIPFKIYNKTFIKLKTKNIQLSGRVNFGNNSNLPVVSVKAINFYVGRNANVSLGNSISFGPGTNIIVKENATFSIGDSTYITSDSHIEAVNKISIGSNCAISWGITIIDDDHHEIIYAGKKEKEKSVLIGNRVWIGCNVTILKGTSIGNNCIVAAGSVLSGNYAANSLIAGNPAKIIKENVDWK